jgi:hypothetical protein
MSRMTDRIASYSLERGIMMDETYTGSPTMIGTNDSPSYSNQNWVALGNGSISTVDGPMPAQKAWRFPLSTNTANSKYLRNNGTGASGDIQLIADNSYSIGFWFKVDAFPSSTVAAPFHIVRPATRGYGFAAFYDNDSGSATYQQNILFITIATGTTARVASGLLTNTWYYVALRRSGANAYVYLNGTQVWSNTSLTVNTTATLTGIDFGNTATLYTQNADICGFYIAGYSTIGASEITDIWNYGSPIQVDIKRYDGSTWISDISTPQVYYSGSWHNAYGSVWNGSAWIPI